ncbi:MAG: MlaE family lipid ABC transporter permease subunit [Lentisphaerae bacterium]|nr:MlaE family lipid ABC transporter permease subunit [Lentisphaerota bacterium]
MEHPADRGILRPVRMMGRMTIAVVGDMGRMGLFLAQTLFYAFAPPLKLFRVLEQIHFIGVGSVLVIVLTGAFTGMVIAFQGYYTLSRVGSTAFLGPMVALSLLRELGPVMAALMVTGRAGSAVTARLGIMRITEQIDELEMLGLSPHRYLVVPPFLAALVSVPLLTAIFNVMGILGGYLVGGKLLGVSAGTYFGSMADYVEVKDVLAGLYKSVGFGGLIAWVCSYKGFYTGFGAEGVSRATTQAVVLSSVLILVCDYVMTSLLF